MTHVIVDVSSVAVDGQPYAFRIDANGKTAYFTATPDEGFVSYMPSELLWHTDPVTLQ